MREIAYFYPRSPRGERLVSNLKAAGRAEFLSTLPARGATKDAELYEYLGIISIHAPREGSDGRQCRPARPGKRISIHAPREGSDGLLMDYYTLADLFLSTLPARGATLAAVPALMLATISIHAPREGSD